jgi:hypothetical protein
VSNPQLMSSVGVENGKNIIQIGKNVIWQLSEISTGEEELKIEQK